MPYDPAVVISGENGNVTTPGTNAVVDSRSPNDETKEWIFDIPN